VDKETENVQRLTLPAAKVSAMTAGYTPWQTQWGSEGKQVSFLNWQDCCNAVGAPATDREPEKLGRTFLRDKTPKVELHANKNMNLQSRDTIGRFGY
jgi:hypothetical protein